MVSLWVVLSVRSFCVSGFCDVWIALALLLVGFCDVHQHIYFISVVLVGSCDVFLWVSFVVDVVFVCGCLFRRLEQSS
jgi:hypothetical protein